jgi:hypothetical protein
MQVRFDPVEVIIREIIESLLNGTDLPLLQAIPVDG